MKFLGLASGPAWLLLAGSALAVVLLYLLKPSPRRLVVTSGLIWQRLLRERKQRPERLRWWLSLLLALVIVGALALALTRPEISAVGGNAEDHVLVIDNSPTMAARSADGRTRLQHALERAADIVHAGGAGSRFLIADTMHQLPAAGYMSRASALARLRSIEPRAGITPWFPDAGRALRQAGEEPGSHTPAHPRRIWLVTDGVAPLQPPAGTQVMSVFQPAPNVGITAFEVRALPVDARRQEAFVEVTNAAPAPVQVQVILTGAGGATVERALRVQGNASARLLLDVSSFGEGALRASLRADADAFDLDDSAYAYLPGQRRVRLALVTPGNAELARALRLLPGLDVEVLGPARVRDLGRFDAAILDRVTPENVPGVPALLIAPGQAPWLTARTAELTDLRIERWDEAHPLLSGVALRDVLIDRAVIARAASQAGGASPELTLTTVAEGPGSAALILATAAGPRIAVLRFALGASNFALQPSFPGFLANTVDWLTQKPRVAARRLGLLSVPVPGARVLDLDGRAVPTREAPGATLFDATRPGLYTAVTEDQSLPVAVNLLEARVTAINGVAAAQPAASASPAARARWTTDPWLILLLLAVLLLAVEWWTYHRRLTV